MVKNNIIKITDRIRGACERSNRKYEDIFLLPVSKTIDVSLMEEAISCGYNTFGENKVQEILSKYEYFSGRVNFHMIGALQTNKVKYIIDKVDLIHSLDRVSLLDKIDSEAKKKSLVANCLVEVNIGKEESKAGIFEEDLMDFLKIVSQKKNVRVKGLMAIVPFEDNPEDTRKYFRRMNNLFEKASNLEYENVEMKILSMGMSSDFEVAIEEGANLVRVGTSIFGSRKYFNK